MIITKEQQEAWLNAYVKEKHTTDECIGFIDGIEKALSFVQEKMNPKLQSEIMYSEEDLREAMKYASEITNNKMKYMEDYISKIKKGQ